jgi:hypothetical protein
MARTFEPSGLSPGTAMAIAPTEARPSLTCPLSTLAVPTNEATNGVFGAS